MLFMTLYAFLIISLHKIFNFMHLSQKRDQKHYGRTDGRTHPLIEMRGRILKTIVANYDSLVNWSPRRGVQYLPGNIGRSSPSQPMVMPFCRNPTKPTYDQGCTAVGDGRASPSTKVYEVFYHKSVQFFFITKVYEFQFFLQNCTNIGTSSDIPDVPRRTSVPMTPTHA